MLVLTFQVGPYRLALDIARIVEVVPRVRLQPVAGGPAWLAGEFVYRGQVVPVVDLHRLLGSGECPPHLSSRIILTPLRGGQLAGLLAAQVAEIRECEGKRTCALGTEDEQAPEFGSVIVEGEQMLRLVDPELLLPPALRRQLSLAAGEAPT
jgi:chemotaxis-related protein WspB